MRLLAVTPTFFPIVGGAELLIRDVLNVWSEEHDVRLLTPHLPETSQAFWIEGERSADACEFEVERFDDRVNLLKWRGHRISRGLLPPMSLSVLPQLDAHIRDFRADALVTFFGVPFGLPSAIVAKRTGIPLVLVLCGNDIPSPRTAAVPLWKQYIRAATRAADRTVYVSRFCFDALQRTPFDQSHDTVIHGGMRLGRRADVARRAELRAQLGVDDGDILLFCLSRLGPEKRVDVVVRAFAALPPLPKRVRLVIGGQGSEAESLKALASELGVAEDVLFTGYLGPVKDDYYDACDIFAFHSLFETFGQVLVEAMAAGKPVVSVRAGAIPEVVADGEVGLLSDPEDVLGMAESIAALVRDDRLRAAMGELARERVERLFDWRNIRDEWAAVPRGLRSARAEAQSDAAVTASRSEEVAE